MLCQKDDDEHCFYLTGNGGRFFFLIKNQGFLSAKPKSLKGGEQREGSKGRVAKGWEQRQGSPAGGAGPNEGIWHVLIGCWAPRRAWLYGLEPRT